MRLWSCLPLLGALLLLGLLLTIAAPADAETHNLTLVVEVENVTLLPGESKTVKLWVENQGDITEQLNYSFAGGNWLHEFLQAPDALEPDEGDWIWLRVTAPEEPAGNLTRATVRAYNATVAEAEAEFNLTVSLRTGVTFVGGREANATDGLPGLAELTLNSTSNGAQQLNLSVVGDTLWGWYIEPPSLNLEAGAEYQLTLGWWPPRDTLAGTVGTGSVTVRLGEVTLAQWSIEVTILGRDELALDADTLNTTVAGEPKQIAFTLYNHGNRQVLARVSAVVPAGWESETVTVSLAPGRGTEEVLTLTAPRNSIGSAEITLQAVTHDGKAMQNLTISLQVTPPRPEDESVLPLVVGGALLLLAGGGGAWAYLRKPGQESQRAPGQRAKRAGGWSRARAGKREGAREGAPEAEAQAAERDPGEETGAGEPDKPDRERRRSEGEDDPEEQGSGADAEEDAFWKRPDADADEEGDGEGPDRRRPDADTERTEGVRAVVPAQLVRPVRLKCPSCGRRISVIETEGEQMVECLWCSTEVMVRRRK